jgi:hypothetical protein
MTHLMFGAIIVAGFIACASGALADRNRTFQQLQAQRYWARLREEREAQ